MASDVGYAIATGLGALAAILGGLIAHRYEHLLDRRSNHVHELRQQVLEPWQRAVSSRLNNLSGYSPFISIDYNVGDYLFRAGDSINPADSVIFAEDRLLVKASMTHWPQLHQEWLNLNEELEAIGSRVISLLRKFELNFPAIPPGKVWADYEDKPDVAVRCAVVRTWSARTRRFERSAYPDYIRGELARLSFWRGDSPIRERKEFAETVLGALEIHAAEVEALENSMQHLAAKFERLRQSIEDRILTGTLTHRCRYCPRMSTSV